MTLDELQRIMGVEGTYGCVADGKTFYYGFSGVEVMSVPRGTLEGTCGFGPTIDACRAALVKQIRGRTLVKNAFTDRREFHVPEELSVQ